MVSYLQLHTHTCTYINLTPLAHMAMSLHHMIIPQTYTTPVLMFKGLDKTAISPPSIDPLGNGRLLDNSNKILL